MSDTLVPTSTFRYWDVDLEEFHHLYNLTFLNERAVELAVVRHWGAPFEDFGGLEVGNVTGHYWPMNHRVFDLHEQPEWYQMQLVESIDILNCDPGRQFPWVLSISTIEHTEDPLLALHVLMRLVQSGGRLLVTFPTGVHPDLDVCVDAGAPMFTRGCTIVRDWDDEHWTQTPRMLVREYGPWANSVFVGEWTAP